MSSVQPFVAFFLLFSASFLFLLIFCYVLSPPSLVSSALLIYVTATSLSRGTCLSRLHGCRLLAHRRCFCLSNSRCVDVVPLLDCYMCIRFLCGCVQMLPRSLPFRVVEALTYLVAAYFLFNILLCFYHSSSCLPASRPFTHVSPPPRHRHLFSFSCLFSLVRSV